MKSLIIALIFTFSSFAEDSSFKEWTQNFKEIARKTGISANTLDLALDQLEPNFEVIQEDKNQVNTVSIFDYLIKIFWLNKRISEGREKLKEHDALLKEIENLYQIPAPYIIALWGLESHYGQKIGKYPVIQALATLAWNSKRQQMFTKELLLALKMVDGGHISLDSFKGSWAGASGQCQFMPSSFFSYAVERDGKKDIWVSLPHIFASIANYLKQMGWNKDEPWGHQITLPSDFQGRIGMDTIYTNRALQDLGVKKTGGGDLKFPDTQTSIIQPLGGWGPTYLIYPNFRVILKWNKSQKFALSVGILVDGLTRE